MARRKGGWFGERWRHSQAARGIRTTRGVGTVRIPTEAKSIMRQMEEIVRGSGFALPPLRIEVAGTGACKTQVLADEREAAHVHVATNQSHGLICVTGAKFQGITTRQTARAVAHEITHFLVSEHGEEFDKIADGLTLLWQLTYD